MNRLILRQTTREMRLFEEWGTSGGQHGGFTRVVG